jgi:hypothetical protein
VDLTTIAEAPTRPPRHRLRRRQVAALIAIVVCTLMALWGTPSRASEASFGAALRSGDVSSWEVEDQTGARYGLEVAPGFSVNVTTYSSSSSTVIWSDSRGRLYRTFVGGLQSLPDPNAPDGANLTDPSSDIYWSNGYQVDVGETVAATARAAGVPVPTWALGPARYLGLPLAVLEIGAVIVLLASAQPRRRTKWGTFWMLGIPAGVGLTWWVLTDSPWSATTDALEAPEPRQRGPVPGIADRRGGGTMVLIAFALSLVVGLGLLAVRAVPVLGDRPDTGGEVTWHVVWSNGSTGTLMERGDGSRAIG